MFHNLTDIPEREIVPGYFAKFVHSQTMTFAYWRVEAGAQLPQHTHPHEQISTVIDGQFELTIDGQTQIVTAGDVATIPGNMPHSGRALTPCYLIDIFQPVREEYR
ncbi:MAG TPA: cupin domain-containing protein [Anaerolineae bacterium]|nr:cupin domain-containing protein [Anaerolineae bacterium]